MRIASIVRLRLRSVFRRRAVEQDLNEELQYHLERQIEEEMAAGLSREEARWAALRTMAGFEQRKEECRDMRGINVVDNLLQDMRFAMRQLRKNPGFTGTAILMLALGMCASVAIFAFVDATLIKPLPYRDPARLLGVYESIASVPRSNLSYPDYLDWKKQNRTFSSLEAYERSGMTMNTREGAKAVRGARVSDGFFRTLGVKPVLGRDFYRGEDLLSAPRTVMLSYAAWQSLYGGKAGVIGQTITLNGAPNTIVAVLPKEFHFAPADPAEFWTTIHAASECDLRRSCHSLYGVGRLKDGVSLQDAQADVSAIAKELEKQYPGSNRDQGALAIPLTEAIVGDIRPILLVLLGGAGLLLLIATVNVASLLLVRSENRKREIAIRGALGASSGRLIGQFVTEALVLVGAGSVLGVISSYWMMQILVRLISADILAGLPYLQGLGLNARVLGFACAIALLAAIVFSLTPGWRSSQPGMRDGLAEGSRGSAGTAWRRFGSKLVVVELAMAMVLLAGAGLLGKSLYRLLTVDIGMQPDHLAMMQVATPPSTYANDRQRVALERQIISAVESLPGVKSASVSTDVPVTGWGDTTWFRVLGRPWHGEHNDTPERDVSSGYFATIGAKLLRGRYFSEAEDVSKPHVAIINESLAKLHFPGEDPLGQHLTYLSDPPVPIEIVGIVQDIKEGQLDTVNRPALYIPYNQATGNYFNLVVRTTQSEQSLLTTLEATIHRVNPGIATMGSRTMRNLIDESPAAFIHRLSAWLVGGFAALALLLGVVGLYGVVAYSVSQRTREIGIRMALGAQVGSVYRLVLQEAGWLTAAGIVIGLVCSIGATASIRSLLFGVSAWDISTLGGVALVLAIAAILASFIPARRAASVNPVEALRAE